MREGVWGASAHGDGDVYGGAGLDVIRDAAAADLMDRRAWVGAEGQCEGERVVSGVRDGPEEDVQRGRVAQEVWSAECVKPAARTDEGREMGRDVEAVAGGAIKEGTGDQEDQFSGKCEK